jgi:hypothetical protein
MNKLIKTLDEQKKSEPRIFRISTLKQNNKASWGESVPLQQAFSEILKKRLLILGESASINKDVIDLETKIIAHLL